MTQAPQQCATHRAARPGGRPYAFRCPGSSRPAQVVREIAAKQDYAAGADHTVGFTRSGHGVVSIEIKTLEGTLLTTAPPIRHLLDVSPAMTRAPTVRGLPAGVSSVALPALTQP